MLVGLTPTSLIPALWNISILLHRQATRTNHFDGQCILTNSKKKYAAYEKINPLFLSKIHNFIFYFWLKIAA